MASRERTSEPRVEAPGPKHNIEANAAVLYTATSPSIHTTACGMYEKRRQKEPLNFCAPVIWHYYDIKRLVIGIGRAYPAEEAERRVF